jgi:predicted DNA-binding transcriptional regulator YafY
MEIDYYTFDEEELFRNILSLGPMAVVLKPESLRQRMIETLKNVLA